MKAGAIWAVVAIALLSGCGQDEVPPPPAVDPGSTSQVQITEITPGKGAAIEAGQTAQVHYSGWLYAEGAPEQKGRKFDSSLDRNQPFEFRIGAGQVIAGWDQGVAGMRAGGKRRLVIPPELGYGARGAGGVIPPGATLVFDVELLAIK
ncbi:MAG: FKBP-type peptidyl-prolyl cis-trans isomerase [Steroidobacteraceae bacterium]